jgi:hypothetical protein
MAAAQRILETGWAYAIRAYPSIGQYIRISCSESYHCDPEPPTWILTGLAGVSKTATVRALQRVLRSDLTFQPSVHTPPRTLRGGVFLTVSGKATNKTMSVQLREQLELPERGSTHDARRDVNEIGRELYRQGCLFIILDESQAIANGAVAGAAFVNVIAYLRGFGLPVIVVGNFSMCHGILAQHSQNRQRLAADPFVMQPDQAHDPDYQKHLLAYVHACGGILDIDPDRDAKRVCELTGGGSRALLTLVCTAYFEARSLARPGGSVTVRIDGLEHAYGSSDYCVFRSEIEQLRMYALNPKCLRKDLINPFLSIGDAAVAAKRDAEQKFAEQIAREKLMSSLSVTERRAIASGELEAPQFVPLAQAPDNSPTIPTASKAHSAGRPMAEPIEKSGSLRSRSARRPKPTLQDALRTRDAF